MRDIERRLSRLEQATPARPVVCIGFGLPEPAPIPPGALVVRLPDWLPPSATDRAGPRGET